VIANTVRKMAIPNITEIHYALALAPPSHENRVVSASLVAPSDGVC